MLLVQALYGNDETSASVPRVLIIYDRWGEGARSLVSISLCRLQSVSNEFNSTIWRSVALCFLSCTGNRCLQLSEVLRLKIFHIQEIWTSS